MVSIAPEAIDVADFQFKEHVRLAAFKPGSFGNDCNLVTVASRYGLIFLAGETAELQVIQVKDIEGLSKEVTEFKRRIVPLPARTLHISVNCDSTKLAVVIDKDNCPHALFYDVLSFLGQNIKIVNHTSLSQNPHTKIIQIDWNPALPDVFTAVKSDGSLLIYEFKGAPIELPPVANAACFCWSPKGKQLAVGGRDGCITQYKIDLKAVKKVEAPPGCAAMVSLCWVSSFQFFGVYNNAAGESCLMCVDAPKAGGVTYTNYYDVCFSNGETRPQQFYLLHQLHWNVLYVASSNSTEIAILGMEGNGKWTQWNLNDNSRAALPLAKNVDTLPIGLAFNVGTMRFTLGEDVRQAPTLLALSDHGMLCVFNAINARPGAMDICSALENVPDRSGEHFFAATTQQDAAANVAPVSAAPPGAQLPQLPGLTIKPVAPSQSQGLFNSTMVTPFGGALSQATANAPLKILSTPAFGVSTPPIGSFGQAATVVPPFGQVMRTTASVGMTSTAASTTSSQATSSVSTTPLTPKTPPVLQTPTNQPPATPDQHNQSQRAAAVEKLPITEETETMIADLVRDECTSLEAELRDLLQRSGVTISYDIGKDDEMTAMAKKAQQVEAFYAEMKDTINAHDTEVYTLKQSLLKTWACFEEARTRFVSMKNPVTKVLLLSMPLDPASQEQKDEISRMMYYIDAQLMQANQSLDEQWDAFQDAMMKSSKLQLPTMESVYQSMVQHCKTVQKQKYMLQHIQARLKASSRAKDRTLLNMTQLDGVGVGVQQLEEELGRLKIQQTVLPSLYNRLLERQSKLSGAKVRKLQRTLGNKEASRVCVSKPQLNNSTVQLTTLFSAQLSPIGKKQSFAFAQKMMISTPKPQPPVGKLQLSVKDAAEQDGDMSDLFPKLEPDLPTPNANQAFGAFGKSESAPMLVVPVPGPGNTTPSATATPTPSGSVSLAASATSATSGASTIKGFSFSTSSLPVSSAGGALGTFKPAAPTASSAGFSFASISTGKTGEVKAKPALLATPTIPPVAVSTMFGGVSAAPATTVTSGLGFAAGKTSALFSGVGSTSSTGGTGSMPTATGVSIFGGASVGVPASTPTATPAAAAPWSFANIASGTSAPTSAATSTLFGSGTSGNIFGVPASGSGTTQPQAGKSLFGGTAATTLSAGGTMVTTASISAATSTTAMGTTIASTMTTTASPFAGFDMSATSASIATKPVSGATTSRFGFNGSSFLGSAGTSVFGGTPATTASTLVTSESTTPAVAAINLSTSTTSTPPVTDIPPASTVLFGAVSGATTAAQAVPQKTPASIYAATTTATPPAATTNASIFGGTASGTTATSSAFGGGGFKSLFGSSTGGTTTSTTSSIFGGGTSTASTAFGKPSSGTGIFGTAVTPPTVTATLNPVVSTAVAAATSTTPAFGPSTAPAFGSTTSSSTPSTFGSTSRSTPPPAFGASTTTSAPPPAFGSTIAPTTSAPPAFGTGSIFGGKPFGTASPFGGTPTTAVAAAATATVASPFGASGTTTTTTSSPFGTTTSASSPFGTATTASSPFGTTTTTASLFGAPATGATSPFAPATTSAFGFSSGNLFAQPAKFTSSSSTSGGGIFGGGGTPAPTTTTGATATPFGAAGGGGASLFGGTPTATGTTSPFGATPAGTNTGFSSLSNSPFAQTASSQGTFASPSPFGSQPQSPPPAFGAATAPTSSAPNTFSSFGGLSMGGGGSTFGQSPSTTPAANPFGGKTDQKPFGSNVSTNLFAAPAAAASPPAGDIFGSQSAQGGGSQGFGSKGFGSPGFGQQSPFGGASSFGSTPSAGGAFSSGTQSVQQAGFGSATNFQQKPSGFGSAAVFGSQPAFGGGANFGSAPTFGGGATFGSPGKVFGGSPEPAATPFGNAGAQSSFGSIAQQNTVGFGNLAQQAAAPPSSMPFSGSSSFTNWRN